MRYRPGRRRSYATGGNTLTIAGIDKFQGGSDVDTFNITGGALASVAGCAEDDVFNISGTDSERKPER